MNNTKLYVGIDPGFREAGVGVIDNHGKYIMHSRLSNWTPHDLCLILDNVQKEGHIHCAAVEKVAPMKGQGISSTGKFMKATGIMIGILAGKSIPFVEVAPQTWKKISPTFASREGESKSDKKRKSLEYIQNRYPESKLTKKIEHNVADALCIAEWLYLRDKGQL